MPHLESVTSEPNGPASLPTRWATHVAVLQMPVPDSETFALNAGAVTVSVAVREPVNSGAKTTLMVHTAPGANPPAHVLDTWKSPGADPAREYWIGPANVPPMFVMVMTCGALVDRSATDPKVSDSGLTESCAGATPVPVSELETVPPGEAVTVSEADIVPDVLGTNAAITVHEAPGFSALPLQLSLPSANCAALAPVSEVWSGPLTVLPLFVTVNNIVPGVPPTTTVPKLCDVGRIDN
jgi:hypothetical protein